MVLELYNCDICSYERDCINIESKVLIFCSTRMSTWYPYVISGVDLSLELIPCRKSALNVLKYQLDGLLKTKGHISWIFSPETQPHPLNFCVTYYGYFYFLRGYFYARVSDIEEINLLKFFFISNLSHNITP